MLTFIKSVIYLFYYNTDIGIVCAYHSDIKVVVAKVIVGNAQIYLYCN